MISHVRILKVLSSMQQTTLHILPEEEAWDIVKFAQKTEECCRLATTELHRKSLMVEEAVEEIVQLVKSAVNNFKGSEDMEHFQGHLIVKGIFRLISNTNFTEPSEKKDKKKSTKQKQAPDWSIVSKCFDEPYQLLSKSGDGLMESILELVRDAVSEMRKYYSRKVADVLTQMTRNSLDAIRRRFAKQMDG